MDTTRRYPRSLAEAFPDVRAPAIERPAEPRIGIAGTLVMAVVLVLLCLGVVHVAATAMEAMP